MLGELTWEYAHLVTNAFPVVLTTAGALVGLAGWLADRAALEKYGVLSLLLAGVVAIPAYFTGLTAADVVGQRTFITPDLIQRHRVWATWTAVVLVSDAAFAGFSLAQPDDRRLRRFVLVLALLTLPLLGWSAYLGGRINHGEQTRDARSAATASPERSPAPGRDVATAERAASLAAEAAVPEGSGAALGARRPAATSAEGTAAPAPEEATRSDGSETWHGDTKSTS